MTKYVPKEFLAATIAGNLRFGTLSEYRSGEESLEARFRDGREGTWTKFSAGDVHNLSGAIGGHTFHNVTMTGANRGIEVRSTVEAHVLCVALGAFDPTILQQFRKHGNASLDCYVVFDFNKLSNAIERCFDHFGVTAPPLLQRAVHYSNEPKETQVSTSSIVNRRELLSQDDIARAIFCKPSLYSHEREFRFAMPLRNPAIGNDALYSKDAPHYIVQMFAGSVAASGGPL